MSPIFQKVENIFLILCLFFGMIFVIINPPFQAPDEPEHLFKMYGYTIGSFNYKKQDNWGGQILPASINSITSQYNRLQFNSFNKTSFYELKQAFKMPLDKEKTEFKKFQPTGYSPLSYFPSFIVLKVLTIFNVSPLAMMYIMRFVSLLLYASLCWLAIKITPVKKWMFTLLALLPMSIYVGSSISTDPLFIGLSFIFIAYTLKLAFDENIKIITHKQLIIFLLLIFTIVICKCAYLPMLFMYFIIPQSKFSSRKQYFLIFTFLLLFLSMVAFLYAGYCAYIFKNLNSNLHLKDTKSIFFSICAHPFVYFKKVFLTLINRYNFYIDTFVGRFGWLDTVLPQAIINYYVVLLLLTSVDSSTEKVPKNIITPQMKFLFFLILAVFYLLTITAAYIAFQIETPYIEGVQGRYFIPLAPMFLLIFYNESLKIKWINLPLLIVISSGLLLMLSAFVILMRYYFFPGIGWLL